MKKGKLLFELQGYKLKGKWTLVKLKKGEKEWLLIKEKDAYVSADSALPPESVLSGLTVEELKAGKDRAAPVLKALARLKAPRRAVRSEEHTSELQSHSDLVCRLLLEKKNKKKKN